jgi:hypothetical protein
MQKFFSYAACTTLLITVPLYPHSTLYITKYITAEQQAFYRNNNPHTLIVWIHGTRFVKSKGFKSIFNKIAQLKNARDLYQIQYYKKIVDTFTKHYSLPEENLYFFGWSGKLCNLERKKSAALLYDAIITLKQEYEETYNITPTFIVIGHSHGGNIILHMAPHHTQDSPLTLDQVILLACPAQESMYDYLHSPLFKKLYALYSYKDIIQILAPNFLRKEPFRLKNIKLFPFSKRRFPQQSNLTQARIVINGTGPHHNEFVKPPFLASLPTLIAHMETWQQITDRERYIAHLETEE